MAANEKRKSEKAVTTFRVQIDLKDLEAGEATPATMVCLMSSSGEILDRGGVNEKGQPPMR